MDIQFLGEVSRVLNGYITGYITKGEKNHTESIWESLNADKSVSSRIMSLLYERFRDREVGAYEMADDLLGHALHGSSDQVVSLGVGLPEKRSRKLKPFQMLKRLNEDSTDTLESNMVETYYPCRHEDLKGTCLYDMVRFYNFKRGGSAKASEEVGSDGEDEMDEAEEGHGVRRKYWCENNLGYFVKRRKPVIPKARYVPCVPERAEEFFQSLLQQFVPYVKEEELMRGKETYKEAFDEWLLQPGTHLLAAARERKERVQKALDLKKRLEEEATEEEARDEQENAEECVVYEDEASPIDSTGFRTVEDYMTDEGLEKRVSSLNSQQRKIYEEILAEVQLQVEGDAGAKQILKFVSGGAGVGKSKLIETLTEGVEKLTSHRVVLAAPTGLAAQNIQGRTAHAVFRLPAQRQNRWAYEKLDPTRAKQMYSEIGQSKLIVIDEVSMVANRMLAFVHLRLQEMTGCAAEVPFGGCNVVVLGDLLQLPPVGMKGMKSPYVFLQVSGKEMKDAFPGTVFGRFPLHLWKMFSYAELTENMRQQDDRSYADMLNELRVGKLTEATATCLKDRVVKVEKSMDAYAAYLMKLRQDGLQPLCIMAKKREVQAMNLAVISGENIQPVLLHAKDQSVGRRRKKLPTKGKFQGNEQVDWKKVIAYVKDNSTGDERKTGGLEDIVILGEGARVMLRRNLDVARGLYNGAQGVVRKVVRNSNMPDGVSAVMVAFDGVPGDPVRVERAMATWYKESSIEVKREQFPLCLSYAITIHKSQGLSLDCVVSDLGRDIFTYGMAYVVLSRVRKLEGLHLLDFDEKSVMCDRRAVQEYNRLRAKYMPELPMLEEPQGKEVQTVLQRNLNLATFDTGDDDCESQTLKRGRGRKTAAEKAEKPKKIVRKKRMLTSIDDREEVDVDPPQRLDETPVEGPKLVRRKRRVILEEDQATKVEKPVGETMTWKDVTDKVTDVNIGSDVEDDVPVSEVTMRAKVNTENSAVERTKRRFSKAMGGDCEGNAPVVTPKRSWEDDVDTGSQFVPLRNPGVHCFGNAAVQALLSCSSGLETWVNGTESSEVRRLLKPFFDAKRKGMGKKQYLEVAELLRWVSAMRSGVDGDFVDGQQHDSHEFLLRLFGQSEALGRFFLLRRKEKFTCQSCSLESDANDELTTEWAMRLRDEHGDRVDFAELVQRNSVEELEKRCVQCGNVDRLHTKCTTMELLPETKYVVVKIDRFVMERDTETDELVKREVLGAITGFKADDVSIQGEKLKVCAAVVYDSRTGNAGHYYTYVRGHGKDRWLICDDKVCTGKASFVPNLKMVMYMILKRQ